jgi:hypothetical protein
MTQEPRAQPYPSSAKPEEDERREEKGADDSGQRSMQRGPATNAERGGPMPQGAGGRPAGSGASGSSSGQAGLIEPARSSEFRKRWEGIQGQFVDEPRKAVDDAQKLLAEVLGTLESSFAHKRDALESKWKGAGEVSTEDLRQAVRNYREMFERLLAA